jgi:3-isopropylmalate/(R)-2-methylmalate dehydratase large subunit
MEGRMTLCNMSIESGARGGLIAPDQTTFEYLKSREFSPKDQKWEDAMAKWALLKTDEDASFHKEYLFHAQDIEPMITFGTNPGMGTGVTGHIPLAASIAESERVTYEKSLQYMGFSDGDKLQGKSIDYVFIGSCTNGRIEDLREFAHFIKGKKKAENITAWIVPGSKQVEVQAQEEGLLDILEAAGFELRQPGCSACLAMNDDKIPAGKYAVSTSNRNFEGRQGPGARTLLASPLVAAACAISGKITDPREYLN